MAAKDKPKAKRGGKRLTEAQQNAIYKAKPLNPKGGTSGPSWASLGRKYGVTAVEVQRGWRKANGRSPTGGPAKAKKAIEKIIQRELARGRGGSGSSSNPTFPIFNMMKRPTAVKPKIKNGKAS